MSATLFSSSRPASRTNYVRGRLASLLAFAPLSVWAFVHIWNNLSALRGPQAWEAAVTHYDNPASQVFTLLIVFVPLVLHTAWGLQRMFSSQPNNARYKLYGNLKYLLQRASALGVLLFLGAHIWLALLKPRLWEGHPERFSEIAHEMHHHGPTLIVYLLGTLGVAYHIANGVQSFAWSWGLVASRRALRQLEWAALALFVLLLTMSWVAVYALWKAGDLVQRRYRLMASSRWLLALVSGVLLSSLGAACATTAQGLLTLLPGVVNDPKNRTLRRELMRFGNDAFCKELQKHGAPLRFRDEDPIAGRFFANQCVYRDMANEDIFVQFSGIGYAWTQPTMRIGFSASGAIQYNQDFLLDGSILYAYFRPRNVQSTEFRSLMVERVQQTPLGGLFGPSVEGLANRIGSQMVAQELSRGFTVIRDKDGSVDFGLGIVEKGHRPFHPFQIKGSDKVTLANDRTEIHTEQRDFLGPFEIEDNGRALSLTMTLDGTPAIDVMILRKDSADPWLTDFVQHPGPPALSLPVLMGEVLPAHTTWRRTVPLAKGFYYVVLDHSSTAGPTNPTSGPPGLFGPPDLAALVNYVIQVGDAP